MKNNWEIPLWKHRMAAALKGGLIGMIMGAGGVGATFITQTIELAQQVAPGAPPATWPWLATVFSGGIGFCLGALAGLGFDIRKYRNGG